jgi:hypothetical protein
MEAVRWGRLDRKYASLVASGRALCDVCGELIEPDAHFELDHEYGKVVEDWDVLQTIPAQSQTWHVLGVVLTEPDVRPLPS